MKIFIRLTILALTLTTGKLSYSAVQCSNNKVTDCHNSLSSTGSSLFQVRDFREVMPGILYRGGATTGKERTALTSTQRNALCEGGLGAAYYLYKKPISGEHTSCSNGKNMSYASLNYASAPQTVNKRIYESIHNGLPPVFVHCWYGIHATGFVAATALIQFCGFTADQAIAYWKVGIAPKLQYPKVIEQIRSFYKNHQANPDESIKLTSAEQDRVCPANPF